MRILATADLHYDIRRSRKSAEALARRVRQTGGDVLVLVGDTAGVRLEPMREALRLFADFPGLRLLVPGNHCLWCREGEDSLDRYHRVLPSLAAEEGFFVLDHRPQVLGEVGLAGSVGWYDYSMIEPELGIPEDFYRAKISPGAARYLGTHEDLLERHAEALTERHMQLGVRWMDGRRVRLPFDDDAFCARLAARLDRQLQTLQARGEVRRIVAFLHHLPFIEQVPADRPDRFAFAAAYLGARRFGELLLAYPKVSHVYCGHSHWKDSRRIGRLEVVNIGSTYVDKHLEILDL
jgi:predicted phosphohydrolase